MEIFLFIFFIVSLIYETYCVSFIKNNIPQLYPSFSIGGALFYFFSNLITIGFYGIYWCVKAEDHLITHVTQKRHYPPC
jgi:hypothetical protein